MSWTYRDEIATTTSQWREDLDATTCGVGYWVTNPQQGKGFVSASLRAMVGHATTSGAGDLSAGVEHGNLTSRRVLEKCGLVEVADVDTYTRFRCRIDPFG